MKISSLNQKSVQNKKTTSFIHNESLPLKHTQSNHQYLWQEIKSSSAQINGRYHHSSIFYQGKLFIYGGFDNDVGVLSDLKVRDCKLDMNNDQNIQKQKNKWIKLPTLDGPGPRHSHSAVCFAGVIYIFGGKIDRFKSTNAIYAYNIKQQVWKVIQAHQQPKSIKNQQILSNKKQKCKQNLSKSAINCTQTQAQQIKPPATDSHKAIIYNKQMIICGGFSNNQFTNDIYSYNFQTNKWKRIYQTNETKILNNQQPEPRADFSMVLFQQKLYMYGGKNLNSNFNDFWEFDLLSKKYSKLQINHKTQNRSGQSAIVYKNYMFIFGGITSVTYQRDDLVCYCFQTKKWTQVWKNCIQKTVQHKSRCKKLSNTKVKQTENNIYKSKLDQQQKEKPRKYRRPLIQQKQQNQRKPAIIRYDKSKKHNQRKKNFLNQLQTDQKSYCRSQQKHFSPLIQSLTNSIMLTSNVCSTTKQNLFQKSSQAPTPFQPESENKTKKLTARDGHTTDLFNNQMIIFGGDRHMNALNDTIYINLDMLLDTVKLYNKIEQQQANTNNLQKLRIMELAKMEKQGN